MTPKITPPKLQPRENKTKPIIIGIILAVLFVGYVMYQYTNILDPYKPKANEYYVSFFMVTGGKQPKVLPADVIYKQKGKFNPKLFKQQYEQQIKDKTNQDIKVIILEVI